MFAAYCPDLAAPVRWHRHNVTHREFQYWYQWRGGGTGAFSISEPRMVSSRLPKPLLKNPLTSNPGKYYKKLPCSRCMCITDTSTFLRQSPTRRSKNIQTINEEIPPPPAFILLKYRHSHRKTFELQNMNSVLTSLPNPKGFLYNWVTHLNTSSEVRYFLLYVKHYWKCYK